MYLNPDKVDSSQFLNYQKNIRWVKSRGENKGHFKVRFRAKDISQWSATNNYVLFLNAFRSEEKWILLTPDGKIKYDDVFVKHPIELAKIACMEIGLCFGRGRSFYLSDEYKLFVQSYYALLKETGIPLFGLDLHDDPDDITESLEKIMEWVEDNAESYDSSEPKVFLPYRFRLYIKIGLQRESVEPTHTLYHRLRSG
jgi:hypothetical protein